jgi:tight adherence protein C
MSEFAILAGFFLFVMAGVTLAGYAFSGWVEKAPGGSLLAEPELPGTQALLAQAFQRVGETVSGGKVESNSMRRLLMSAGYRYPSAVPILSGIKYASAITLAAGLAGAAVINNSDLSAGLVGVVCGGGFGFLLPEFILKRMIRARAARIRRAIPVALDLLTLSVEAGQALNQAVVETSVELQQAHPDLSDELAQVNLELRAGKSRAEALLQLGARSGDVELKRLSSLLIDSDRFGTSLGPALRTHAKYLRTRLRQEAQESARKVAAKLIFPIFFLIFPSVLLVTLGPAVLHMTKHFTDMVK